jgi:predicted regulator of Ras-like GTPase activity (Roadblock/LC7/MglB family)
MKAQRLRDALDEMAAMPSTLGCALVELDGGMVWHTSGSMPDMEELASATSDYWRLNRRGQKSFSTVGELRLAILVHKRSQILVSECGMNMLLVVVTELMGAINWDQWKTDHARLTYLVDQI